jgi:hypothetical protein
MLICFDGRRHRNTEFNNKNAKLYAKLVVDIENDEHDNPKSLGLKIYKKTLRNNGVIWKCDEFCRDLPSMKRRLGDSKGV